MPIISTETFHDFDFSQIHQAFTAGWADFTGSAANFGNWTRSVDLGIIYFAPNNIYVAKGSEFNSGEISLSGGQTIYNQIIPQMIPNSENYGLAERTITQSSSSSLVNCAFIGKKPTESGYPNGLAAWFAVGAVPNTPNEGYVYTASCGLYTQNAAENPTEWSYNTGGGSRFLFNDVILDDHPQTKIYRAVIENVSYFVFAFGVNGNEWNNNTWFVAIPVACWEIQADIEYIGKESEPDPETGFDVQPVNVDSVDWATISDTNPYGVNSADGGLSVVLPTKAEYSKILGQVYRGDAEGAFNLIEQIFSSAVGGNTHRPADEVQAILSGILSLHTVPTIADYDRDNFYFATISGYSCPIEFPFAVLASPGEQTIFSVEKTIPPIPARMNSFLDYEPYTHITLKLPFFNPVDIPASDFWEFGTKSSKTITCRYLIDILSGLMHVDVKIKEHLLYSMSTSVKTEIPIIGSGSNGGNLAAITKAISSTAELAKVSGGNPLGLAAGAVAGSLGVTEALSHIHEGTTIGKGGFSGLAPSLEPRQAYIIITTPREEIPHNHIAQVGMQSMTGYDSFASLTGWNVFRSVDLSSVDAPQAVKDDIIAKLRQGVFII